MSKRKVIGIVLIVGSLGLGYKGVDKVRENDTSIKIFDMKIDISNETEKQQGYIYLVSAVIFFVGGIYTLNKTKQ